MNMMFPKPTKKKRKKHKKSIMQPKGDRRCYLCMLLDGDFTCKPYLEEHHVLFGNTHAFAEAEGDETLYKNQEGYCDPTAGKAIQDASRIPHHVKEAHKALKDIASLLGFEVLVLRDRKTGRVYRWKQ